MTKDQARKAKTSELIAAYVSTAVILGNTALNAQQQISFALGHHKDDLKSRTIIAAEIDRRMPSE